MLLIAGCAAGAGVTGTLLLTRGASAPAPAFVPVAPAGGALDAPASTSSEPPPTLGQGQPPAQASLTQANWFYDHERWAEAASRYKTALDGGVDNADVRTDYGNALRFSGQPRLALEQYRIAQQAQPSHEQSLFNQGGLWAFSLHDRARGIAAWQAYLKKFPHGQSADDARKLLKQAQSGQPKP